MKSTREIVEMEILSGIEHAFHNIMADDSTIQLGKGYRYKKCKALAEDLKATLPDYIDGQCDLIGRKSEYINFLKKVQADNPEVDVHIPD